MNTVSSYVTKLIEDAIKAGLAAAGVNQATTLAGVTTNWQIDAGAFIGGFFISVVFSLISQPFGDKSSTHIFGNSPAGLDLDTVVKSIAATAVKEVPELEQHTGVVFPEPNLIPVIPGSPTVEVSGLTQSIGVPETVNATNIPISTPGVVN